MRVPCSCWEVFPDVVLIVPYPLCLASIFQHVYLSIFVWWHLLCAFHSSSHWLTPSFLLFFFFFNASKATSMLIAAWAGLWRCEGLGSELAVTFVNNHLRLLVTAKGTTWPARTHRKAWAGIWFWQALPARPQPDCQCVCSSVDLCARVHECYCGRFPERPLEQNGQTPGIFFLILARGKVRRVSIHRHEALEAISLKTGQRSGQMTCTAEQILIWHGGRGRGGGRPKEIWVKKSICRCIQQVSVCFAALVVSFVMSDIVGSFFFFRGTFKYSAQTLDGMSRQKQS